MGVDTKRLTTKQRTYKTANTKQRNNKTAKNKTATITKQRTLQKSELCEKRRIDHTEYGQFSFRSIRCFSRSKNDPSRSRCKKFSFENF